jgi:hypothetical protein
MIGFLTGRFKVIKEYSGSSKFDFWKSLKEDDIITIVLELKDPGRGRGLYSTTLNLGCNNKNFRSSITETLNYLSKMEVKQI